MFKYCQNVVPKKIFIIFAFTYFILLAGIVNSISNMQFEKWIVYFAIILGVTFTSMIVVYVKLIPQGSRGSALFLVLTFLFHFSHIPLIIFNYNFDGTIVNIPFVRYGQTYAMKAFNMAIIFSYSCFMGIILNIIILNHQNKWIHLPIKGPSNSLSFGLLLFIISSPFFLFKVIKFLYNTRTYGYNIAANIPSNSYINLMGTFLLPALILLMTSQARGKKAATKVLLLGCIIYAISMLTGQRAYNLMYFALLIYIYISYWHNSIRISIMHFFCTFIGVFIISAFLSAIRSVRAKGMSIELLTDALQFQKNNPILDMLNEFAITGNIVTYVVKVCRQPMWGQQLLASFMIILPGISYIVPIDWSQMNLTDKLGVWNLGGSYIADLYYDFRYWGWIGCVFLGFFIHIIFTYFHKCLRQKQILRVAFMGPIICEFLFCVRSTLFKIPRFIAMYTIIFILSIFIYYIIEAFINAERTVK